MTTNIQKISLIIIGLIITILMFEVCPRVAGVIYKTYRINNKKNIIRENKDSAKILCLGDSFIFGLGAESRYDYPAQLDRILNGGNIQERFVVYNQEGSRGKTFRRY